MVRSTRLATCCLACLLSLATVAHAQVIQGVVRDQTGGVLPGVSVELLGIQATTAITNESGEYIFDSLASGTYRLSFALVNFAPVTRGDIRVEAAGVVRVDAVLHLMLSADVTVTGRRTFANLADAEHPAEDLVGIAQ